MQKSEIRAYIHRSKNKAQLKEMFDYAFDQGYQTGLKRGGKCEKYRQEIAIKRLLLGIAILIIIYFIGYSIGSFIMVKPTPDGRYAIDKVCVESSQTDVMTKDCDQWEEKRVPINQQRSKEGKSWAVLFVLFGLAPAGVIATKTIKNKLID